MLFSRYGDTAHWIFNHTNFKRFCCLFNCSRYGDAACPFCFQITKDIKICNCSIAGFELNIRILSCKPCFVDRFH